MKYIITPLTKENYSLVNDFKVNPERCGNSSHFEDYLKHIALSDIKTGKGTTNILIEDDEDTGSRIIIGFITLKASSLVVNGETKLGYPALEIAELAIREGYEGKGFGSDLVSFAIDVANSLNGKCVGFEYLTLCADKAAVDFYKKIGFREKDSTYYTVPREGWNDNCISMGMKILYG